MERVIMSNFLIFKAAFNGSATPAIGTYTAEGATAQFNKNSSISSNYYLYNTAQDSAVQWFVPTTETTDFEFVADILTRSWNNRVTYFIIADSTGTTRLRMWSVNDNWHFENSDSDNTSGTEYIGTISPTTSGGFGVFHQFRVRVRKLTESSSSVEIYVDNTLKLTATAGAALVTCAKIGFVGGVNTYGPRTDAGVKNVYLYDFSNKEVIDCDTLSNAFIRFIGWAKSIFAAKNEAVLRRGGNLMTGTKLGRPDDSETFSISGGTTVGGNTGYVKCYGVSASGYPGAVEIGGYNIKFIFRNGAIESWAGNQDLGSSNRQFGTAYIKALNINGTVAGNILTHNASEFVNLTSNQTIGGVKTFSSNVIIQGSKKVTCNLDNSFIELDGGTTWGKGGSIVLSGQDRSSYTNSVLIVSKSDTNTDILQYQNGELKPLSNNTNNSSLGTSTNKWKTLNGINPGALSLPSISSTGANAWIALDTTDWVVSLATSNAQKYMPPADGWLNVRVDNAVALGLALTDGGNYMHQMVRSETPSSLALLLPVFKDKEVAILVGGNENFAYTRVTFYPCQGNV